MSQGSLELTDYVAKDDFEFLILLPPLLSDGIVGLCQPSQFIQSALTLC